MSTDARLKSCRDELVKVNKRLDDIQTAKREFEKVQRGELKAGTKSRTTAKEIQDMVKLETSLLAAVSRLTLTIAELEGVQREEAVG